MCTHFTDCVNVFFTYMCHTEFSRIIENFEMFGTRIQIPESGFFAVSRPSYSLNITEPSYDDIPMNGYCIIFDGDYSHKVKLPKSLFISAKTRVSASLVKSIGIFSGRDSSKVVASNVITVTLNGRTVVGLEDQVITTFTKLRNVIFSVCCDM